MICSVVAAGTAYRLIQRQLQPQALPLTAADSAAITAIRAVGGTTLPELDITAPGADKFSDQREPDQPRPAAQININTATLEQLESLPNIGVNLAQRIITERTARGRFTGVDDLLRVPGIGTKRLDKLRPLISCDSLPIYTGDK